MKTICPRCKGKNITSSSDFESIGWGDRYCLDCSIYFFKKQNVQVDLRNKNGDAV